MEYNKGTRIFAGIFAFLLIGGLFWYANSLVGNPISKILANKNTKNYIRETYTDMELELEDAEYDLINKGYKVSVRSPFSIDTHFSIYTDYTGDIIEDSYENRVVGKLNTIDRINAEYQKMVAEQFNSNDFNYDIVFDYSEIKVKENSGEFLSGPLYGLELQDIEIDENYDIKELSKKAGHISLYTEDDTELNSQRASKILLDIKTFFDEIDFPFYSVSLSLQGPNPKKMRGYMETFSISDFLYSDIYKNGLVQRVDRAAKELEDYRRKEEIRMEEELMINPN